MDKNKINTYIGITIGPIYGTISQTSSPAGMWAASYMFSMLSLKLCEIFSEDMAVFSPNFEAAKKILAKKEGFGLIPDHLIFQYTKKYPDDEFMRNINARIAQAKNAVADILGSENSTSDDIKKRRVFYDSYFQVHAILFETGGNPIEASAQLLSAIELEKPFPIIDNDQFVLDYFDYKYKIRNNDEARMSRNKNIKGSALVTNNIDLDKWQLINSSDGNNLDYHKMSLRELVNIAGSHIRRNTTVKKMKKHSYYAIIQADGDGIGSKICALPPNEIDSFSKDLIQYAHSVSTEVGVYGGVTIYAGGDDLLAIVPAEGKDDRNILTLLSNIKIKFQNIFDKYNAKLTLSAGCAIFYYKFPLYEAFVKAYQMLKVAKGANNSNLPKKNTLALHMQKHSGQSVGLRFTNWSANECADELERLIIRLNKLIITKDPNNRNEENEKNEKILNSATHKIRAFEKLFAFALKKGDLEIQSLFANILNDKNIEGNDEIQTYLSTIHKLLSLTKPEYLVATDESDIRWFTEISEDSDQNYADEYKRLRALDGMLRFAKFYLEEEDKRTDAYIIG